MNAITLPTGTAANVLTTVERATFERDGFLALPGVLDATTVAHLHAIADRELTRFRAEPGTHAYALLNQHDLLGRDDAYLDLVDHPRTFPKVFGILGWNIQVFHTQLVVTPPQHPDATPGGYAWHQDNNRMNLDLGSGNLHPRVSVKVAYFLSDVTEPGMGNLCVIPASHREAAADPTRAIELTARAGDAVVFDRRLWHSASSNGSGRTRVVVFVGYSHRWLRPKSAMDAPELLATVGPIRRQLLGAATGANGYFDPSAADVPLRTWLERELGPEHVAP